MMAPIPSTLTPPGSAPMTNSANKDYKPNKGSASFSHKSNNPNTDFVSSFIILSIHILKLFYSFYITLQTFLLKHFFVQLIFGPNQNKKQSMNHQSSAQERDISSSEDHCRCEACKNQEDLKNYQRQNLSNIYMLKHLKKRGVPPVKKDFLNKQLSHKAKYATKKEELQKKLEPEKTPATPAKHKLIQVLRSKEVQSSSFFIQYHPVSHSQREKLPSKDAGSNKLEQPRRVTNIEEFKSGAFQKDNKPRTGAIKLVEISENPENIRMRQHISRSVSQASANCNDERRQESVKSLQKIKQ